MCGVDSSLNSNYGAGEKVTGVGPLQQFGFETGKTSIACALRAPLDTGSDPFWLNKLWVYFPLTDCPGRMQCMNQSCVLAP